MINIYSAYSYLSNLNKDVDNKENFSLTKLAHLEIVYYDLYEHDKRIDNVKSSQIEKGDIVYLAKYSYIPKYLVEQFSDVQITDDITKCTKICFVINNLFDNRNGFYLKLRNNDYCIVSDSLYDNNIKLAISEMDKEIPNEGVYKLYKTIATTKSEYEFILNNPDKVVDRYTLIEKMSEKQSIMTMTMYDQIVELIKSSEIEFKKMALSSLVTFSSTNEENKLLINSILNEYDELFYNLKTEPEYLYLTEGYRMFEWALNNYDKSKSLN